MTFLSRTQGGGPGKNPWKVCCIFPKRPKNHHPPYIFQFHGFFPWFFWHPPLLCSIYSWYAWYTPPRRQTDILMQIRNDIDVFSCGFCGGSSGCSVNFKKTTHHTFIPTSNCKMYKKFSLKSAMTSTTNTPCTNRPVKCDCCSVVYWSYALEKHYKEKHPESECTEIVSEKEKDTMMKCIWNHSSEFVCYVIL